MHMGEHGWYVQDHPNESVFAGHANSMLAAERMREEEERALREWRRTLYVLLAREDLTMRRVDGNERW
jgi:hypothetical protein